MRDWRVVGAFICALGGAASCARVEPAPAFSTSRNPLLSGEVQVDLPFLGNARGPQGPSAVAWNGTEFLVAWVDGRLSPSLAAPPNSTPGPSIFAARIGADGTVLDPTGIPVELANGGDPNAPPVVGSDGRDFYVAWNDARGGVFGTQVLANGQVVSGNGMLIVPPTGTGISLTLGGSSSGYLLGWREWGPTGLGGPAHVGPVPLDGGTLPPDGGVLAADALTLGVTYDGQHFIAAWSSSDGGLFASEVSIDGGAVLGAPFAIPFPGGAQPAITSSGAGDSMVIGYQTKLAGSTLARDGGTLAAGAPFTISAAPGFSGQLSLGYDGAHYLAAWRDGVGEIFLDQLIPPAASADVGERLSPQTGWSDPVISSAPSSDGGPTPRLLTYDLGTAPEGAVWAAPLNASLLPSVSPAVVTRSQNEENETVVSSDGTGFLAVWSDDRTPSNLGDIWAAHLTAGGGVTPPAFAITSTAADERAPAIAFNGDRYLVTWQAGDGIHAALVGPAGADVGPDILVAQSPLQNPAVHPTVVSNGTDFLVAWMVLLNGGPSDLGRVSAARISDAGTVLDATPLGLGAATGATAARLSAAFGANGYLVAWTGSGAVTATLVQADGTLDPDGGVPLSGSEQAGFSVAVGFDPDAGKYLAAWVQQDGGLFAVQAKQLGRPTDPALPVTVSQGPELRSSVVLSHNGAAPYLAWFASLDGGIQLQGTYLNADLTPHLEGPIRDMTFPTGLGLASNGQGQTAVAYSHFDPALGSSRAYARISQSAFSLGAPCGAGPECLSGFCSDGVCCDSACGGGSPNDCMACSVDAGAPTDGTCATLPAATHCGPRSHYGFGCGCTSEASPLSGVLLGMAAWALRRRRL